jgi:hypothetical protein
MVLVVILSPSPTVILSGAKNLIYGSELALNIMNEGINSAKNLVASHRKHQQILRLRLRFFSKRIKRFIN